MTKDEAIKIIKTEMECVSRPDCDRLACAYCDLAMREEDVLTAYQMAIEALEHPPIVAAMCTCARCGYQFTIDLSEGGAEA